MSDCPELPGVRHEHVNAGGLRTHVALAGPATGPPVLLVHGWPQNWWAWRHVIPQLAATHRVVAADLRGHGWTAAPRGGYDKHQLATDLLNLLDELELDRVTWIGHDWGGWTGFLAALRAPERFERMLALAIPHLWGQPDPLQILGLMSYQVPISLPLVGERIADPMVRRVLQVGRGGERLSDGDVELFARQLPPHVTVAMYRTAITREMLPVVRGTYAERKLEVPTTLFVGGRDVITRGTASGPVRGQPQLQVEVVDGVAHWIPEQRPQAIVDWLTRRA